MFTICVVTLVAVIGCDPKPSSKLKGQTNTTMTFYGLAVDESGRPLPDVKIEYEVAAYPKDWTFETRDRPYQISMVAATTDEQGRFKFTVTGCALGRIKVEKVAYRCLFEEDAHTGSPSTNGYDLIHWGDLWFKSDFEHPAIYVLVKDGAKEVSALPSRGGFDSGGGKTWQENKPAWPKRPSLKDVVYRPAATQPTTKP